MAVLTSASLADCGLTMKLFSTCYMHGCMVNNLHGFHSRTLICGTIWPKFKPAHPFIHMILKVQAHAGNAAADALATQAQMTLPQPFWTTLQAVRAHRQTMLHVGSQVFQMQIALRVRQATVLADLARPQQEPPSMVAVDSGIACLSQKEVHGFPEKFQTSETAHVLNWLKTLVGSDHGVTWVTFHQLLVDYQRTTGRIGPFLQVNGGRNALQVQHMTTKRRYNGSVAFCNTLSKATECPVQTEQRKPSSLAITFWCGAVQASISMSPSRLTAADDHFRRHARCLPARQSGKELGLLPPCRD